MYGSAMGLVKLGNFIPWDIDMDVSFPSEQLHHYKPGGAAHSHLAREGLELYAFRSDRYGVAGAGMFFINYKAVWLLT